MIQMMRDYWAHVTDSGELAAFQNGMLTGALTALVLILVLGVFPILLRLPRRAKGVTLEAPLGALHISATAVADLVRTVGTEFSAIDIMKVVLYRDRKELRLYVAVSFSCDPDGQSVTDVAAVFQQHVSDALKRNLGIDSIRNIVLDVRRGKQKNFL